VAGDGRQQRDAAAMLRQAIVHAGGGGVEGKRAGENPHCNAELRVLDPGLRGWVHSVV
jgi:hypothetical protein